jgi:hypothetical protein
MHNNAVRSPLFRFHPQAGILRNSPASVLPFAAILSPGLLPGSHLPIRRCAPVACVRCLAYASNYSRVRTSTGEWSCCFCGADNAPSTAVQDLDSAVDWIEGGAPASIPDTPGSPDAALPSDPAAALASVLGTVSSSNGSGSGSGSDPVRIIAMDLGSSPEAFDRLKDAVFQAIDATPDSARVALVAFGTAAAVCRLPPTADVLSPRSGSVNAAHFDAFVPNSGTAGTGARHRHVAPLGECRELLHAAVGSLRPQSINLGLQRLVPVVDAAISLARVSTAPPPSRPDQQATAQEMERPASSVAAHLVLLTASAPLHDPERRGGAAGLAEALASAAGDHGVVIDVLTLAEGPSPSDVPSSVSPATTPMKSSTGAAILGALATGTGGRVLAHAAVGPALAANLQDALSRGVGGACTLEIRCSEGLAVGRAAGPLEPLTAAGRGVAQDWNGQPPPRLLGPQVWGYLANPPDMHQSVTIALECTKSAPSQRHLYIQAAVAWTAAHGARTVRVVTRRLDPPPVLARGNLNSSVQGVRWGAVAVAFAKQVAGEALQRGAAHSRMQAEVLRKVIGEAVKEVAEVVGAPDESSAGWFSGPSRFFLPPGAAPLAAAAFHLQRCALHRGALSDGDAREMFFSGLAAAPLEVAERMAAPALWVLLPPARGGPGPSLDFMAGPAIELQRVPAADLALLLSTAAVVDAGSVVYVWLSRVAEGAKRMEDACMEHAQRAACSRSPQADVVVVQQGDAAAARVLALLAPLARDRPRVRARQLPLLAGFREEQIEAAAEEAAAVAAAGVGGTEQVPDAMGFTLVQWLASQGVLLPRDRQ